MSHTWSAQGQQADWKEAPARLKRGSFSGIHFLILHQTSQKLRKKNEKEAA